MVIVRVRDREDRLYYGGEDVRYESDGDEEGEEEDQHRGQTGPDILEQDPTRSFSPPSHTLTDHRTGLTSSASSSTSLARLRLEDSDLEMINKLKYICISYC